MTRDGLGSTRADRLRGGVLGHLVGDALGVPYEFHEPETLPVIDMQPPDYFARSHAGVLPGTWSDDGAQALALLASLLEHHGQFVAEDFAERLVRWSTEGYLAVGGHVFDMGLQTGNAIRRLKAGIPALQAGPSGEHDNGNGALMRVLPLALVHVGTDRELVRAAEDSSRVTHGHARSRVSCALYCLWARRLLEGRVDAWQSATQALRGLLKRDSAESEALELHIRPDEAPTGRGTGYVVDSLRSARWCFEENPRYADAVVAAVALGHDTDTTAAITGGVAGVRGGMGDLPEAWIDSLRGRDLVDPLLEKLVALAG